MAGAEDPKMFEIESTKSSDKITALPIDAVPGLNLGRRPDGFELLRVAEVPGAPLSLVRPE